ncbi:MAG: AAA family ATPase [Nitrospirae bacterium]|nr:AAA family ATPase [Nitrospirota bacterium]
MLTAVEIRKFRTCQPTKFKLNSSVSALIGQNGAGKTNILQAVARIGRIVRNVQEFGLEEIEPLNISIDFTVGEKAYRYNLVKGINYEISNSTFVLDSLVDLNNDKIVFKKNFAKMHYNNKKTNISPEMPAIHLLYITNKSADILSIYNYLASIKYYHTHNIFANPLGSLLQKDKYDQWRANPSNDVLNTMLWKLYDLYQHDNDTFNEISMLLKDLNLIDKISFRDYSSVPEMPEDLKKYISVQFRIYAGGLVDANQLSEGTKRVISILLNMFYDKSSLMLIEEPESSIHYGLLVKLIDILRAYSDLHQVLFSTHSADVLNTLKPEELLFVKMENNKTKAKNPTKKQIKEIQYFLNNIGPLGEYITTTGGGDLS